MSRVTDDAALDALAAALAPRVLREVRALLAAETGDAAGRRTRGIALLAELGYEPGHGPGSSIPPTEATPEPRSRSKKRRTR